MLGRQALPGLFVDFEFMSGRQPLSAMLRPPSARAGYTAVASTPVGPPVIGAGVAPPSLGWCCAQVNSTAQPAHSALPATYAGQAGAVHYAYHRLGARAASSGATSSVVAVRPLGCVWPNLPATRSHRHRTCRVASRSFSDIGLVGRGWVPTSLDSGSAGVGSR